MFKHRKSINRFAASCLLFFLPVVNMSFGAAVKNINDKVAQLDTNNAALADVVRIFGEPEKYLWGNETFTKNNLPESYIAGYPDNFSVVMSSGKVSELRFESPAAGFIFRGKIQVGSTLDDVLAVVGQPRRTVTGQAIEWEDGALYKDIDGKAGYCYYKPADQNVRFFFTDYKVGLLYLTAKSSAGKDSFNTVKPITSVEQYDDVRWKDMSKLNLSSRMGLVATLTFNQDSVWPAASKLPQGNNPVTLLKKAMNPGLGVRNLHRLGITGKGINVAIIDQPLYLDHPEFAGKIVKYYDTGCDAEESSMHGPAVASLLAGTNCGTAPDARIYYAAAPSWKKDAAYYAKALDWIIEQNNGLPASEKIRAVSVSAAPSGPGSPFDQNQQMWDQACASAGKAGILVLDCTNHHGFIGACWYDAYNPESVAKCTPGFPGLPTQGFPGRILVPASPRTTAEEFDKGKFGYQYCGRGGLSWTIPYCAGVLALGWQVNPDLSAEQMRDLLFKSAYVTHSGDKIINPNKFINLVKKTIASPKTEKSEPNSVSK